MRFLTFQAHILKNCQVCFWPKIRYILCPVRYKRYKVKRRYCTVKYGTVGRHINKLPIVTVNRDLPCTPHSLSLASALRSLRLTLSPPMCPLYNPHSPRTYPCHGKGQQSRWDGRYPRSTEPRTNYMYETGLGPLFSEKIMLRASRRIYICLEGYICRHTVPTHCLSVLVISGGGM